MTSAQQAPSSRATDFVVPFRDGDASQRDLLGGKGANLAEMTRLGLPVPPGFTITTEACRAYLDGDETLPPGLTEQVAAALAALEEDVGRKLGNATDPLLVSVRSGAAVSMPGMMDTVLNLGLNGQAVQGLAEATDDERFAWDSDRRFVQLFGKVVLGVPGEAFDDELARVVAERGVADETALDAKDLHEVVKRFTALVEEHTGTSFPREPWDQLLAAVEAVFRSWNGRRARDYRRYENIPDDLGTAVTVQAMVFGNRGADSGTGVVFTRNPATGEAKAYGDWLPDAQGEDVVAGIRNTEHVDALATQFPDCHRQLSEVLDTLERHYRDLCDVEFTVERGRLFVLQTRVGKRTAEAALQVAVDMVEEGLIDRREAVRRITPGQLEHLLHPRFAPDASFEVAAKGLNASPGAAVGKVMLTADRAEAAANDGEAVILVRGETSPDDVHGMIAAEGILTARGGLVSHAAVVARAMGRPAVCGVSALDIDLKARTVGVGDTVVAEGDILSLNGSTGEVVVGPVPLVAPEPSTTLETLLGWADEVRTLGVRANADTADEATQARTFGAQGIGLCRTEHMFLGRERLPLMQRMILADTEEGEREALAALEEIQRSDFVALLQAMDGLPITVRLLDPPLHEFLPDLEELLVDRALGKLDDVAEQLLKAAQQWRESNPMLGTRGCRLGVIKPELYRMQTRALLEAAVDVKRAGGEPHVEIMIPLVSVPGEFTLLAEWIREAADGVLADFGEQVDYKIGTMIETPRAALTAGQFAEDAAFFSFGTNDLTQMTYGFSRDDVEARVIPAYLESRLMDVNPFQTLDAGGVGRLMALAVSEGRAQRPDLSVGVCGEHGGDPDSVRLCHELGLDYVSCSPYRLPIARVAAAHAALAADSTSAGT